MRRCSEVLVFVVFNIHWFVIFNETNFWDCCIAKAHEFVLLLPWQTWKSQCEFLRRWRNLNSSSSFSYFPWHFRLTIPKGQCWKIHRNAMGLELLKVSLGVSWPLKGLEVVQKQVGKKIMHWPFMCNQSSIFYSQIETSPLEWCIIDLENIYCLKLDMTE